MGRIPREQQFAPDQVNVVHVTQRCIRRAFLAGVDRFSGVDYSFRREWIRRRMEALASVFAIDVLSYAVLSNHIHLILRNRPDVALQWSDQELAIRWLKVFPGRRIEEHLGEPTEHDVQTLLADTQRIALIRARLSDLSWFMRALCEPIARMANRQDECSGRFWEGRFKAQRISDEAGLLACAMYVDLNPVRAAIADSPDQATHTSAFDRIQAEQGQQIDSAAFDLIPVPTAEAAREIRNTPVDELREKRKRQKRNPTGKRVRRDAWLAPLTLSNRTTSDQPEVHREGLRASNKGFLGIRLTEYLELLCWTALQRETGSGREVPQRLQPLLTRLGIDLSMWRDLVWNFSRYFKHSCCAGSPQGMSQYAAQTGRHHVRGQRMVRECFIG